MAFRKTANAGLVVPHVSAQKWQNFRDQARGRIKIASDKNSNLIHQATEIFQTPFNPEDYLLTHCTIVCSVDTLKQPGVKTGSVVEDGQKINRKWNDFRVTADTDAYINNNLDCWSREVILAAAPTFVGAHNFVEHVQVEDLSKGRVIDAAIRDIGKSLYVDILVATNRKHAQLIGAIESGKLGTLSMGCSVLATICTKCGNVAADETDLCSHIKFLKGNVFFDEMSGKHRIAELCGHHEMQPTAGVHFIEASWVESPAFQGAVMRNILDTPNAGSEVAKRAEEVLNTLPPQWSEQGMRAAGSQDMPPAQTGYVAVLGDAPLGNSSLTISPAASGASAETHTEVTKTGFEGFDEDEGKGEEKGEKSPLDDAKEEVFKALVDDAKERAINEIRKKEQEDAVSEGEGSTSLNDNLNRAAGVSPDAYRAGLGAFLRTARGDADLLDNVALFNRSLGIEVPLRLYRTALRVGGIHHYPTHGDFLSACRKSLGMDPNESIDPLDRQSLLRLGHLLHLRSQIGA